MSTILLLSFFFNKVHIQLILPKGKETAGEGNCDILIRGRWCARLQKQQCHAEHVQSTFYNDISTCRTPSMIAKGGAEAERVGCLKTMSFAGFKRGPSGLAAQPFGHCVVPALQYHLVTLKARYCL